jgi:hypothetical protein
MRHEKLHWVLASRQDWPGRSLVELQPVAGYALKGGSQFFVLYRLLDTTIGPELVAMSQLPWIIGRGEYHDGRHAGPRIGPNGSQHLEPVQFGELQIQQDEPGRRCAAAAAKSSPSEQEVEGLLAISGHFDLTARVQLPQGSKGELDLEGTVLDQEDVDWAGNRRSGEAGQRVSRQRRGHSATPLVVFSSLAVPPPRFPASPLPSVI